MRYRAALALVFALLAAALPAAAQNGASQSAARLEDIGVLCETIKSGHPNPFTRITEEDFDRRADDLRARLSGMSDARFYYELRALVAAIGDSHTAIDYIDASRYAQQHALPFAVTRIQGAWYAAILPQEHAGLLGDRVVSIDGTPIETVFERAKALISFDNEGWAAHGFSNTINFLEALQFLGVTGDDAAGVTLTLQSGGQEASVFLPAMTEEEIMAASTGGGLAQLTPKAYPQTAASGYYRAFEWSGALFIQYNVCQEAPDLPMADFAQAVESLLREGAYGRVLLDLRYNSGGNSAVAAPLFNALDAAQDALDLDVYVLIGEDTFSSAVLNAVEAKERFSAVLVGQPTGGSVNAFGEVRSVDLPNSPLRLTCSTRYFEPLPGYGEGPLLPDVPVEPTLSDLLEGRDAVAERALAL